jgi:SAM-dependent methyltransferase
MSTMPRSQPTGQPAGPTWNSLAWFASAPGQALLDSESDSVRRALAERRGHPWLWLSPVAQPLEVEGLGMQLHPGHDGWKGAVRCDLPLPLPSESVATVVVQHVAPIGRASRALVQECARVLIPGGRCWLYGLNPLSPYRWRWTGSGLRASEPMPWRWRLREAGLDPDPVSEGLGPRWRLDGREGSQHGLGLRAAYLLRAEKRTIPLTPLRSPALIRLGDGVSAA